jgi:hypothetical protein
VQTTSVAGKCFRIGFSVELDANSAQRGDWFKSKNKRRP